MTLEDMLADLRTGNAKLAMDAIGDRDIRMADRYIKTREDALRETFEAMDQGDA